LGLEWLQNNMMVTCQSTVSVVYCDTFVAPLYLPYYWLSPPPPPLSPPDELFLLFGLVGGPKSCHQQTEDYVCRQLIEQQRGKVKVLLNHLTFRSRRMLRLSSTTSPGPLRTRLNKPSPPTIIVAQPPAFLTSTFHIKILRLSARGCYHVFIHHHTIIVLP